MVASNTTIKKCLDAIEKHITDEQAALNLLEEFNKIEGNSSYKHTVLLMLQGYRSRINNRGDKKIQDNIQGQESRKT